MQKFILLLTTIIILLTGCDDTDYTPIDTAAKPGLGILNPHNLPKIKKFQLENGLNVYVVENNEVPIVSAFMLFNVGIVDEPAELQGLADVTVKMISEGTEKQDGKSFIEKLESTGAYIETKIAYESIVISMTTLKENIDPAFSLFSEALLLPAMPEPELNKLIQRKVNHLNTIKSEPYHLANEKFNYVLYGAHPFGRSYLSSESFVSRITRNKVLKFYQKYFTARNGHLILSGDISPKEAKSLAVTYFESMRAGEKNIHDYATPPAKNLLKIHFVGIEGAKYASIRIGSIGLAYNDPIYYKALVMNEILGGYADSRINKNFSGERGWSKKVETRLHFRNKPGPFYFRGEFETDKVDSAIQIVLKEFKKIVETQPAIEELNKAKAFITGSFYLETETAEQVTGKIQEIIVHDLPKDYLKNFASLIANVTPADVQEAAGELIDLNKLSIVVVGDPKLQKKLKRIAPTFRLRSKSTQE